MEKAAKLQALIDSGQDLRINENKNAINKLKNGG